MDSGARVVCIIDGMELISSPLHVLSNNLGIVHSAKMKRTIIVRRDYLHYIPKYNRFEKRHRNVPAHASPAFRILEGDGVVIGQCRYVE
jgi:ribosomal protein S17